MKQFLITVAGVVVGMILFSMVSIMLLVGLIGAAASAGRAQA